MADPVLLAAVASQLRLVQADCADEDAATRGKHLQEVLRQYLDQVLPQERRRFLEELEERFPSWEIPNGQPTAAPPPEPSDPYSLAQRLVESMSNTADEREKDQAKALLQQHGLAASATADASEQFLKRLREVLGIAPAEHLDLNRFCEVAGVLLQVASELDAGAWKTWRGINPKAASQKVEMKTVLKTYLTGQRDVPLSKRLDVLRKLVYNLFNALTKAPTRAYQEHFTTFDPVNIQNAVLASGGGSIFGKPTEAKCWLHYLELASGLEQSGVERAFKSEIIKLVSEAVPEAVNREM